MTMQTNLMIVGTAAALMMADALAQPKDFPMKPPTDKGRSAQGCAKLKHGHPGPGRQFRCEADGRV